MKKTDSKLVGYWVKRYLQEYLPITRNLSRNTILSYRDAIHQLLQYINTHSNYLLDKLMVEDISENLIIEFLTWLEKGKSCSISTRNQRLAAIHSFAKYIALSDPQYTYWFSRTKTIPIKRSSTKNRKGKSVPKIAYLEKDEMQSILSAPDRDTEQGARDYALLMFLYNSGARATEVANIKIGDLVSDKYGQTAMVTICGKGNKTRICPLWSSTVELLMPYRQKRAKEDYLFLNRYGEPITRFGIYEIIARYAKKASINMPSLKEKNISPHTIRHSTATHLLT